MSKHDLGTTTEKVEVVSSVQYGLSSRWQPVVSAETLALLDRFHIPEKGKERLKQEAVSILSNCIPPSASADTATGLVIGYVQSGKTMSFTTVAALARDNNYKLILVLAGASKNLLDQSTERLKRDLNLDNPTARQWKLYETKGIRGKSDIESLARNINNTLDDWTDDTVRPNERKTVLITAMKQYQHLDKLRQVLEKIKGLLSVPTLIIDDEADQRSLNTKVKKGEQSTTYQRLVGLRNVLPHHTFLQYTATPQAPLLINLIDILSPGFVQVLTPGEGYVGGKEFFIERQELIKDIPLSEIPTKKHPLNSPPSTLVEALQTFYLGIAADLASESEVVRNRSMLVHPAHKTISHKRYYDWIKKIEERWRSIFELPGDDPDRVDLIEEFHDAYLELATTVHPLPSFDELIKYLPRAIRATNLAEVNSRQGTTPSINWQNEYGHILVGGQSMDRGFTIEGLTITYMPRGKGTGNADTIQQRARFFGYKQAYFDYCRVYLDDSVCQAFRHYVQHEEDIRNRLKEFSLNGRQLSEWKRAFFINRALKPCRDSVIDLDYFRGSFASGWFIPKAPHDSLDAIRSNRAWVNSFCTQLAFEEDDGSPLRTEEQKHWVVKGVSLRDTYEQLLVQLRLTRYGDSQKYMGALLQIDRYLDLNPDSRCTIYSMSKGNMRTRRTNDKDEIPQLHQGRNPLKGVAIYPGDSDIRSDTDLTIQIHNLKVVTGYDTYPDVPTIALHFPGDMVKDWLVQPGNSALSRSGRK